jgi:RNA polymerase sigma factor (sigma-70 family)
MIGSRHGGRMAEADHREREATAIDWGRALGEHRRWLRAVLWARLRDADAIEEALQEIAVTASRQPARVKSERVGGWLYRAAIRQAMLQRRRWARGRRALAVVARSVSEDGQGDPLDWLLTDERRDLVRQALAELPDSDVEILLLKYAEDWSYREIARRLGASESAVEARLHRARGRLRQVLSQRSVIEFPP